MPIQIRKNSIATRILFILDAAEEAGEIIFSNPHQWARWALHGKYTSYKTTLNRLMDSGFIQITDDEKQKLKLTKEGKIQILMAKAFLPRTGKWDGKWRVIFFDIPETNAAERTELRRLLIKNEFKKLQASVYVSPWPLNREALRYLKQTGLIRFIRFGRLDELDEDGDLKKVFKLIS
jgi:DNA-binding transcriptional regulator PaaX